MTLTGIARLSRRDLGVLLEAAALLPVVDVALLVLPLDLLVTRLSKGRGEAAAGEPDAAATHVRAALLVDRLGALYPLRATCLKKSLVLLRILRRRGYPAELRLGVRSADGRFSSHAWIECGGQLLLDEGRAADFRVLTIPAPPQPARRRDPSTT